MGEIWMAEGHKRVNPFPGSSLMAIVHMNYLSQMGAPAKRMMPTLNDIFTDTMQSLGVDPVLAVSKRRHKEVSFARIIYCYIASLCTYRNQDDIAAVVNLNRSMVSTNRKKAQGFLSVRDAQFEPYWDRYTQNSKIYKRYLNDKGAEK